MELDKLMKTAIVPLYARAEEGRKPDALFNDQHAVNLLSKIRLHGLITDVSRVVQNSIAVRTRIIDDAISEYLKRCPDPVIINLGAGFDFRYFRLDNGLIRWFDIDLAPVIELKKSEIQETERFRMIGKSVFDYTWLDDIDVDGRPALLIAEGLLMYLRENQLLSLLNQLVRKFPRGNMLIELLAPGAIGKYFCSTQSTRFNWTLLKARDIEVLNPKLRYRQEWCVLDFYKERWGWMAGPGGLNIMRNYFGEKIVAVDILQ